jgi:hypothetical protein
MSKTMKIDELGYVPVNIPFRHSATTTLEHYRYAKLLGKNMADICYGHIYFTAY